MKVIDLNIPIRVEKDEKDENGEPMTVRKKAQLLISIMLERAINRPDPMTGRPTVAVNMETQRKYFNVMNAIERSDDGKVELSDDDFNFLKRKFNQAEIPVQRGITEALVAISDAINKAEISEKSKKGKKEDGEAHKG